jgi:hypothetical protein
MIDNDDNDGQCFFLDVTERQCKKLGNSNSAVSRVKMSVVCLNMQHY